MRTKKNRGILRAMIDVHYKYKAISIVFCLICLSALLTWLLTPESFYSLIKFIGNAVINSGTEALLTSLFLCILVYLLKNKKEEEAKKQEIQNVIVDSLGLNPEILDVCREEQIDKILKRCISYYNQDIAEQYQEYIRANLDVVRKNFEYNIDILENNTDDRSVNIRQYLSYERCFKVQKDRTAYELKCYFSTSNDLDEQLAVDTLFFREELTHRQLLAQIKTIRDRMLSCSSKNSQEYIDCKSQLIELVGLTMYLGADCINPISNTDIEVEINEMGILFSTKIPKRYIKHSKSISGDEYISYNGRIICSYQANMNNQFYCIFSNVTIGATRFKLTFSENIFRNLKDKSQWDKRVSIVSMLSMKDKDKRPKIDIRENQTVAFTAATEDVIFPRSGIVITWDPLRDITD